MSSEQSDTTLQWSRDRLAVQGWVLAHVERDRALRAVSNAQRRMDRAVSDGARRYVLEHGPTRVTLNNTPGTFVVRSDSAGLFVAHELEEEDSRS